MNTDTDNNKETTEQKTPPSFKGEIVLSFPLTEEEKLEGGTDGNNTFLPRETLRGEQKWSFPFPAIALSEDAGITTLTQHLGEDFLLDIIEDGLIKYCQQKWRASEGDVEKFKESFFDRRRDLGPTPEKISKKLILLRKELREKKEKLGKTSPEVLQLFNEIKKKQAEMQELMMKDDF